MEHFAIQRRIWLHLTIAKTPTTLAESLACGAWPTVLYDLMAPPTVGSGKIIAADILPRGYGFEVGGIAAETGSAFSMNMVDIETGRNRTDEERVCHAVRPQMLRTSIDVPDSIVLAICRFGDPAMPQPAVIGTQLMNERPEALDLKFGEFWDRLPVSHIPSHLPPQLFLCDIDPILLLKYRTKAQSDPLRFVFGYASSLSS